MKKLLPLLLALVLLFALSACGVNIGGISSVLQVSAAVSVDNSIEDTATASSEPSESVPSDLLDVNMQMAASP